MWFYDMQADGFCLDDKRSPVQENDIPDIVERFHNLEAEARPQPERRSPSLCRKAEIAENGL